jgi:hypothetical protein
MVATTPLQSGCGQPYSELFLSSSSALLFSSYLMSIRSLVSHCVCFQARRSCIMAEPFSAAASSFAVIGLIDVVLRAGKEVYQFLGSIQDAPTEVDSLRCSIHDNALLVEELKRYWGEIQQSVSSASSCTTDLSQAIPQFTAALRTLNRELSALVTLAKRHDGITKSWGKIKWVLDQRKVLKIVQRLEVSKSTLGLGLMLVGR